MDIFFCDIRGTYSGNPDTRDQEIKEFINNIVTIAELDGVEKIIFSFVSSENMDILIKCMNELKPYLNDHIKLGIQFADNGAIYNGLRKEKKLSGKLEQILIALSFDNNIENIYFADDCELNNLIVSEIVKRKSNKDVINFVPGSDKQNDLRYGSKEKGISGLNKSMNDYITTKQNNNRRHL